VVHDDQLEADVHALDGRHRGQHRQVVDERLGDPSSRVADDGRLVRREREHVCRVAAVIDAGEDDSPKRRLDCRPPLRVADCVLPVALEELAKGRHRCLPGSVSR